MKRGEGGLWLSARAAATILILGGPTTLIFGCKFIATTSTSSYPPYHCRLQPRIHLCDYVAQVADADTTCNGIRWERVLG